MPCSMAQRVASVRSSCIASPHCLAPAAWNARLAGEIGARPTTGLMAIDMVARSGAAGATLYGFDFFASLSLSGGRTARDVPHDFAAERAWVERLVARDPRFALWGRSVVR